MKGLTSKVALVTGAAQGVGEACARRLAEEGVHVLMGDIQIDKGKALAAEIGATFCELDVSNEEQFAAAISLAVDTWGQFDFLINNAAVIFPAAPIQDTTNEEFDRFVDVNFRGMFLGCKLAHPHLKKSKGAVVSIASMAGVTGQVDHAVYGATKGAVNILTKCAAADWGKEGIRVNSVCPCVVLTPAVDTWLATQPDIDVATNDAARLQVLERNAEPSEIASVVAFLCSDDASFITGCNMPVSGGSECGYKL